MDIFRNARQNFLRRQAEAEQADLERQQAREQELQTQEQSQQPEMQQRDTAQPQTARPSPMSGILRRFADIPRPSMPSMPSFGRSQPRPTSSHYTTASNIGTTTAGAEDDEIVSPKTPQFGTLGMPPMPSTRLHLPNLQRTWTRGSSGPPSRPGTATNAVPMANIAEPVPAVPAQHVTSRHRSGSSLSEASFEGEDDRRQRGRRRRFEGADPAEMHLASMADDGRRRRRERRQASDGFNNTNTGNSSSGRSSRRHRYQRQYVVDMGVSPPYPGRGPSDPNAKPKKFLFCFPYIKSRRLRAQILRCCVSGTFTALMLGVFLALYMTNNIYNTEFAVLLILIMLFTAVFFVHGLIRVCVMALHPLSPAEEEAAEEMYRRRRRGGPAGLPDMYGPGGYAIPHQPIRVVLARDEEAAGLESVTTKIQPPAYGLWRESVRVDPNRIYWQRNEETSATGSTTETTRSRDASSSNSSNSSNSSRSSRRSRSATMRGGEASSYADSSSSSSRPSHDRSNDDSDRGRQSPRPPSYMSEDGVQYVVEAQPRSIAPTTEIPLPQHPSEAGRTAPRPAW
ncbi:hypothetical protein Sste5346_007761 [Sporothrix stenoceras]|uniref:Uncharacterized protein n=1 Tax=Sporothrix stenoceras TaxID=5173 RepID=A0ABR3YSK8_9PEZI